jgi:hypothetical protein
MEPTPMLQMNFEQDSSGKPGEWAAYFTDVQGSIYVGRAATPEAAVLDLAGKIRQEMNRKSFAGKVANALNQPLPSILPGHQIDTPETVADMTRIANVGKTVWYMPASDDVAEAGRILPAIITREWAGSRMDLYVFGSQAFIRSSVEWSASKNSGTWDWPKKS